MREALYNLWNATKRLALTVLVLGLLTGTCYAFFVQGEHKEVATLEAKLERLDGEVERARRHNRRLKLLIASLRESDNLLEKIAREDYGLIKPGEILYIFPD